MAKVIGQDIRMLTGLERTALVTAWLTVLIGIAALVGWLLTTPILYTWGTSATMKPGTAVAVILLGAAVLLLQNTTREWYRQAGMALAGATLLLAVLVLMQYLLGAQLGIDRWLAADVLDSPNTPFPGRVAPTTALALIAVALSVLLLGRGERGAITPSQIGAVIGFSAGLMALVGLIYDAEAPAYLLERMNVMAFPSGMAMLLLGTAVLCLRPSTGVMQVLANQTLGGLLLRRLLAVTLLFPLLIGMLREIGEGIGLFDPSYGLTVSTVLITLLFTGVVWWAAGLIDRLDAKRQAQATALRESEERFRNLLETSQEGVWLIDLRARTTYVNRRMQEMLGYSAAEMLGRPLYDFVDMSVRPEFETHFQRRSEGVTESYDFQFKRKDGSTLWVIVSSSPIVDSEGRFHGVLKMVADITARKEAEERLLRSEQALARAQEVAHLGSWEWDVAANKLSWSDEMLRIYGVQREAFGGSYEDYLAQIHPDDRERVRAIIGRGYEECVPFYFDHRVIRPDGEVRHLECRGECVVGPDGQVVLMRGTGQDITERKLAELALLEAQQRFQSILANAGMAIYIKDLQGRYAVANESALSNLGREHEEVLGRTDAELFGEEVSRPFRENELGVMRSEEVLATEELVPQTDGVHTYWSVKFPMRDAHGTVIGVGGISQDITDRKLAEQEIREKSAQLEQLNNEMQLALQELAHSHQLLQDQAAALERSNADLDDFAYIASHDLKEPLRGISNYANFLAEDYASKLDAEGQQMLLTLPRLTKRLEGLLDALLKYSRLSRADVVPTPTDLQVVIEDVQEMLEARIEEHNAQIRLPRPLPTILCDRSLTSEIFLNLISNGIKYNDEDQRLIEIGYEEVGEGMSDESLGNGKGRDYVFYVSDNGIGIPEKYHDTVFGAFRRLHGRERYGGGTGVGLAIVKKMVERQGGRIWLSSEPGQGTTFYFTLHAEPVTAGGGMGESRA